MQKWIKVVDAKDLDPHRDYFIGRVGYGVMFISRGLDGKLMWSVKPGIAIKFTAKNAREHLGTNADHVAILVPKDAATRWRARKRHFYK